MRRLVAAWVRMWASSPMSSPWAANENTSTGGEARSARSRIGPTASRRNTSRSTASGASTPNQAVRPGPWLIPENAWRPEAGSSTTRTGAEGPRVVAIGTTVSWWFAGSRVTPPPSTNRCASSGLEAQPSATTVARTDRRSGSQNASHGSGGPGWSTVSSPIRGTTSMARATRTSTGAELSRRRRTSALAGP